MGRFHDNSFPGENAAYRAARDELLEAEIALRKQTADVAAMRQGLPLGGAIAEDYVFDEAGVDGQGVRQTRLSDLFAAGKDSLLVYSFMYGPDAASPCPACTSLLDNLNGGAPHIRDRVNFAVVAKAPIQTITAFAEARGWRNLRLLSSGGNSYNSDYFAQTPDGAQLPAINVFRKSNGAIYHSYNAELFYAPTEPGQHPRHADQIWPLWNVFDLTPDGRGEDWFPKLAYD